MCDVVLVSGSRKIAAHRVILAGASSYFAKRISSLVQSASTPTLKIEGVDEQPLLNLVDFMYSGGEFWFS